MRLVAQPHMQSVSVSLRIDRDSAQPQPLGGAGNAAGDLAAVGDQDGFEHSDPVSIGPILACRRRRRLRLWTFWRHRSTCGRLFSRRVGGGCAGLVFRRRRLSIHDADRRN